MRSADGTVVELQAVKVSRPIISISNDRKVAGLYIGRSDVTEFVVTIRSPFCGYNVA